MERIVGPLYCFYMEYYRPPNYVQIMYAIGFTTIAIIYFHVDVFVFRIIFFRNTPCPLSDVGTVGAPNGIVYSSVRAI